jgi:hypothetical protein
VRGRKVTRLDPAWAFLAFAVAVAAMHHLPTIQGREIGTAIDLFTPPAVVGTAAAALVAAGAPRSVLAFGLLAALLYVDGHGIHLAANDIHSFGVRGEAGERAKFWDERWGHGEWHVGWIGLLVAFCLAERARPDAFAGSRRAAAAAVPLLGFTLFTSMVEGQTWPLVVAGAIGFGAWAAAARRPLVTACAAAFVVAALLVAGWALWQGGVPECSDVWGW